MSQHQPSLSAEQWQQHIAAWQASGVTQADYCKKHALIPHTFWYWKKKLSHVQHPPAQAIVSVAPLVPVMITDAPVSDRMPDIAAAASSSMAAISVHVGSGCRIDLLPGFDPATLRQALAILRE